MRPLPGAHLGEPPHVVPDNLRVGALEFLDDLKALVELGEDVHHGAGEERVLRRLLELCGGGEIGGHWGEGSRPHEHTAGSHPVPIDLTPSFLSRSSAPCRKSRDTSSFSSNHWITKGSNHLQRVYGECSQHGGTDPSCAHHRPPQELHSRGVLRDAALEGGQLGDVLVVQPLHLEVQVHVVRALAQAVLVVLCVGKVRAGWSHPAPNLWELGEGRGGVG